MKTVHSTDGTTIAYERFGDGPPLILVGGAFNDRTSPVAGVPLAELLAPHFAVYVYDRRGRGDSGDTQPYAVDREVEDLQALITAAGGSAFVYGHSSGAVLALEAARRVNITKLALYEPPVPHQSDAGPSEDPATRVAELVSSGRRGDAVEYFVTRVVGMPVEAVAQMRHAPFWPALESLAHTLVYDLTITRDFSLEALREASLAIPALVLDGEASPASLRQAAQAVGDALPNGEYRSLEGQTHDVSPDALAPVLKGFLSE